MPRLRLHLSLLTCLCGFIFAQELPSQTLSALFESGPRDQRINIVILSEGYTAEQLDTFPAHATAFVDHFLGEEPFLSYKTFFNAYAISVASAESGADIPSENIFVNTAFDATFESSGIDRLLTVDTSKARTPVLNTVPEYDIILVLVNSDKYGGSGGSIAVTSLNTSSSEIATHEIGHSFGGLADEYELAGGTPRESPNATAQTSRESIVWNQWIDEQTPIPTPAISTWQNQIGLFEGAAYRATDWYRPHFNSKMRTLGKPWGSVNSEQLILKIFQNLPLLENPTPANPALSPARNDSIHFSVEKVFPSTTIEWTLNDLPVQTESANYTLDIKTLPSGSYQLSARIFESTPFVRNDPNNLLSETHTWTITVPPASGGDTAFINWIQTKLPNSPEQWPPTADPDHDGRANLLEFFLGTDPNATDSIGINHGIEDNRLFLQITRPQIPVQATATIESSQDLENWNPIATSLDGSPFQSTQPNIPPPSDQDSNTQRIYDSATIESNTLRSLRLKVEDTSQ